MSYLTLLIPRDVSVLECWIEAFVSFCLWDWLSVIVICYCYSRLPGGAARRPGVSGLR